MGSTIHFGQVTTPAALKRLQRLMLQTAMVGNLTYGQMANGMFDRFKDANGIDGGSVYTLGTGYCAPVIGAAIETWSKALDTNESSNWAANLGMRILHPAAGISTSGPQMRITLQAVSAYQSNFTHVCFAENAGSGNAADVFGSAKFKELLFSGATGTNITAGGSAVSDWLTFDVDETKNYMTIIGFPAINANVRDGSGDGTYLKATASSEYATQNISGYTSYASTTMCVSKIEVLTQDQNMILISNSITASVVASQAIATVLMLNKNSSTKVYVSTATSPSWTELTGLTKVASTIGGAGIDQYSSDLITITGSADKSMRWKVETDAGHSTACYGVVLSWI